MRSDLSLLNGPTYPSIEVPLTPRDGCQLRLDSGIKRIMAVGAPISAEYRMISSCRYAHLKTISSLRVILSEPHSTET